MEDGIGLAVRPPLFSDFLKEALDEHAGTNKDEVVEVEVNALSKILTVHPHQVLVIRPNEGINIDLATSDSAKNKVQMALKSIPVDGSKKTRNGGLVMEFPFKEYRQKANAAIKGCFE